MSEAHVESTEEETVTTDAVTEEAVETKEETTEEKPNGTEFVDLDEMTPAQQARFNRIYGNMKQYERVNSQLVADQRVLVENVSKLEKKLEGVAKTTTEQRVDDLKEKKAAAYEENNIERVMELDDQIADARETAREPDPVPDATQNDRLPLHVEQEIQSFAYAVEDDGIAYKRPWMHPDHPKHAQAAPYIQQAFDEMHGASPTEILAEAEKRVRKNLYPQKQRVAAVLNGDGNATPKKESETKLNTDQKYVAHRMYEKLTPKEAEERYAKSLAGV